MANKKKTSTETQYKTNKAATTQNKSTLNQTGKQMQRRYQTTKMHQYNLRSTALRSTDAKRPSPPRNFIVPGDLVKSVGIVRRCQKRLPSIQIGSVQPLIRRRNIPIPKTISDFQRAINALHLSMVPETLPCREEEFREIFEAIKTKILDNSGGCMYVCGVPGTGKSSTVARVVRSLQRQSNENTLPQFELIQMNAMQLTEPQQAYVHIYRHLHGKSIRWSDAISRLDKFFIGNKRPKRRKITILVADEFDMLKSPGQRVIYNLLNWSMTQSARFIVVAVGNIIDPGRIGGITSRLGATRFTFLPYTQLQLKDIVRARLTGINIYENDAVELVARKVASISGDCRRALDIFRRATEIAEKDCIGKALVVTTFHVVKAFNQMIVNLKVIAIKGCSKYEKLFLQAVGAEVSRTGADETVLYQVYRQFETICLSNCVSIVPEPGIALRISSKLGSSRLLICEHSNSSIHQKIMLNVTFDELRYAFD